MVRKTKTTTKITTKTNLMIFLTIFIVIKFIFSVLEIINCDYLIKYIDNEKFISDSTKQERKKLPLVIKYYIIIFIIISFIFGGLLFYEKIRDVKFFGKYRIIIIAFVSIILFIADIIKSIFSILISVQNKQHSNNKHIINIQNVTIGFNLIIILCSISIFAVIFA